MINDSDGDTFLIFSLLNKGWFALVCLLFAGLLWFIAYQNREECAKRRCPREGQTAQMFNSKCACVDKPEDNQ